VSKKVFSKILAKHFGVDPEGTESSGIFKMFRVTTSEQQVVNVLEFMTAVVLLAQLGESSPVDLQHNSELVEHKINLMLLLFDFRGTNEVNISEVIIMLTTAVHAMQKIYPETVLFKNQVISDEIKLSMMNLFGDRLEQGVLDLFGEIQKPKEPKLDANTESFSSIMVIKKPAGLRAKPMQLGILKAPDSPKKHEKSQEQDSDWCQQQQHIGESLEQKKRRLFKWSYYEKVMLPLGLIKEKLLQNTNVIRFLSLFCDFTQVTLVWGDNQNLNQGLHIQSNFTDFYNIKCTESPQNLNPDKALHDLLCLSKQHSKSNDDLVYFQALLSKWSDTLQAQRASQDQLLRLEQSKRQEYKRILEHHRPTIMMCMLNTHV
jgi:hypothetical protein